MMKKILCYGEGISLEERSRIICKFGVKKEEREENYDEVPVKTENTHVRVQSDESGDTQQDEIISGFNENDGDNIDSKDEILCAIKGKETQDDCQQVDCGSETFPDTKMHEKIFIEHQQKEHEKIHTDVKNDNYEVFGKTVINESLLGSHEKLHSVKKSCICAVCGKGFTYKSNLEYHEHIHTGDKTYSCAVCGKKL
ncbi:uncharacterized protein LOC143229623 isoform X2 [Tachypleus tridentatus]|uniref:uncharacterized protein LOC143229623 isoform X2 n=1 Tax=Tachypleus tridentatus TaxID=6853 RepID=UPI003FD26629